MSPKNVREQSRGLSRTSRVIGVVLFFLVLLEPLWMLLPFAGFLYGSVLDLEFLKASNPTIWLLYFVFPVQTLMPLAIALSVAGLGIFLATAFQVYRAKLRRSGLVTSGLYRFSRNPQYVALVLFSAGILLMWGRVLVFIFFFLMMFMYYLLARREEGICRRLFGRDYEDYARRTPFLLPGDRVLRRAGVAFERLVPRGLPLRAVAFLLWMGSGTALALGIVAIRLDAIGTPDNVRVSVDLDGDGEDPIPLHLLRGFDHHLYDRLGVVDPAGLWEDLAESIASCDPLRSELLAEADGCAGLLAFPISRTVSEKKGGPPSIGFIVYAYDSDGEFDIGEFASSRERWNIRVGYELRGITLRPQPSGAPDKAGGSGDLVVDTSEVTVTPMATCRICGDESRKSRRLDGVLNIYLTGLNRRTVAVNRWIEGE